MSTICCHSLDEYIDMVKAFHGHVAPGMVLGGFMVDLAYKHLPDGELLDALSETPKCLPDAIQLLTPCTVGNGWLRVINLGRYALSLYEKRTGEGVRVFVDPPKLKAWPEIETWFFKLKPKKEQDRRLLLDQVREAGPEVCSFHHVWLNPEFIKTRRRRGFAVCPFCQESYPADDGGICLGCQGEAPYLHGSEGNEAQGRNSPSLQPIPVEQAAGKHALHDMTRIIPGVEKGPAYKKDQQLTEADVCRLQKMGRQEIYVTEVNPTHNDWIHEDEAALEFSKAMAGEGIAFSKAPSEGKAELLADRDGLLVVDERRLERFNLLPGVVCASRHNFSPVIAGEKLAGTRALPLFLHRREFENAKAVLGESPLFRVLPFRKARVGILVTGTEVFRGLIEDRFAPIIREKVEAYGCAVVGSVIVPDEREIIRKSVDDLIKEGADLLITTAGLSVDPDDVTRQGLADAGAVDMIYGTPILPGNMTLLAHIGRVQVIGVPACALYHRRTSFDLLLPRLLTGIPITRQDLAKMGHGSMCMDCEVCAFPRCAYGK